MKSDMKQGKGKMPKAGAQAADAKKKKSYPKSKHYQGDTCCTPADFDRLTGRSGVEEMKPKVTAQPTMGPSDATKKGGKAGEHAAMPDSQEDKLMPTKARQSRNSRTK